jgi:hypothetical protein
MLTRLWRGGHETPLRSSFCGVTAGTLNFVHAGAGRAAHRHGGARSLDGAPAERPGDSLSRLGSPAAAGDGEAGKKDLTAETQGRRKERGGRRASGISCAKRGHSNDASRRSADQLDPPAPSAPSLRLCGEVFLLALPPRHRRRRSGRPGARGPGCAVLPHPCTRSCDWPWPQAPRY